MQITEEQRRRAEANRLAALEKRKRAPEPPDFHSWKLSKCAAPPPFRAVLEICSPDEFCVAAEPLQGSPFPGQDACLCFVESCVLSVAPFCSATSQTGRKTCVFKLLDYEMVLRCIKKLAMIELQEIPYSTRLVVEKFSHLVGGFWSPCVDWHLSDEQVEELTGKIPVVLKDSLFPFQLEGVRFGLRRGGCCLIADEMGLGKTIQALAIASCFIDEGPILIVCPAVLRFSWAEEIEHWIPTLRPKDIHLVFGRQNDIDKLEIHPKVVVISYQMLNRLSKSMSDRNWSLMIVDESHNIRCTKKQSEKEETKAVLKVAAKVKRKILLSGTPSFSRPYDIYHQINMLWPRLLGQSKYEFAKNYCLAKLVRTSNGLIIKDFSKGIRLGELNILLKQTVMIRRLKEHVLAQLPPKRRQIIWVMLKAADIISAKSSCRQSGKQLLDGETGKESMVNICSDHINSDKNDELKNSDNNDYEFTKTQKQLSLQEVGIAKLSGFREWFSNHFDFKEFDEQDGLELGVPAQKTIIFAHHLKVLDGVQALICEKEIKFVRIDGNTPDRERKEAVEAFRYSNEVKIAIIGITVGSTGLNLSSAQNVVFMELPRTYAEMAQAEDRAHRQGQINAVNVYIFCAKDTVDVSGWQRLNKRTFSVSSMMNGKRNAIKEIEVDTVLHLKHENISALANSTSLPACVGDTEDVNSVTQTSQESQRKSGTVEEQENCLNKHVEIYIDLCTQTDTLSFEDDNGEDSDLRKYLEEENRKATNSEYQLTCNKEANLLANGDYKDEALEDANHEAVTTYENYHVQAESLRFEVSQYTGRVHLYLCIPGEDSRPKPAFENFRQEELAKFVSASGSGCKEISSKILRDNPAYCFVLKKFLEEWNDLRAVDRNKLFGKPLQVPLSSELLYLDESINHNHDGLLRGGSNRRVTPINYIYSPLPENAVWRKVKIRIGSGKEREYTQAWTNGETPLCKLCQEPCNGQAAKAPEYFEDLFCNLKCFQEYRIRTSQAALRQELFRIEHGVCVQCKLDCHALVKCIRPLSVANREKYVEKFAPNLAKRRKLLDKLIHEPTEGNAWHADHIIPVYKGGGECRLENMRTLCVACHSEVTKAQQMDRRLAKMRAKEQLKIALKEIKNMPEQADDGTSSENVILVKVPGSAYSRTECFDNNDDKIYPED